MDGQRRIGWGTLGARARSQVGGDGVAEGSEHHGDHERGEDVAEGEVCGGAVFLEGGDPEEDEEVHGPFKYCLCEPEDKQRGVCDMDAR